jgi:hypothetical protein
MRCMVARKRKETVERNEVDRSTGLAIYEQHHRPVRAPSIPKQGHRDPLTKTVEIAGTTTLM